MRETGDLTYAGEAASTVAQVVGQCRLDLFVVRPLRAQIIKHGPSPDAQADLLRVNI